MTSFSPVNPVSPVSIHLPMLHNHLHVNVKERRFRLEINTDSTSNLEKKDTKLLEYLSVINVLVRQHLKVCSLQGGTRTKVRANVIYS